MRAVLVFCEGNHDIVFARRSLGALANAVYEDKTIGELPYPIGYLDGRGGRASASIIETQLKKRTLSGMRVRAAAHAPPPSIESVIRSNSEATHFVLIRTDGDSNAVGAVDLVKGFKELIDLAPSASFQEFATAFLFDADKAGLHQRESDFSRQYLHLFGGSSGPVHNSWVQGTYGPVGLFVFHDPTTRTGTLDAELGRLVASKWPVRWGAADDYVREHARSDTPVTLTDVKHSKALIGIAAQFVSPGSPMTEAIDRNGLDSAQFATSAVAQELVTFLTSVPW